MFKGLFFIISIFTFISFALSEVHSQEASSQTSLQNNPVDLRNSAIELQKFTDLKNNNFKLFLADTNSKKTISETPANENTKDASVEIQKQPTEIVEATPLNSFDDKTYSWPSKKVPQSVLEVQGNSLYEALNKYPSIQAQGEESSGSVSVRIRGSGSVSRNLFLVDGTPLQSEDGTGSDPLLMPYEIVDTLEVIKGPASLFYGSNAVGGAIHLKTRKFENPTLRIGAESAEKYSLLLGTPIHLNSQSENQLNIFLEDSEGNFSFKDSTLGNTHRSNNSRSKQRYNFSGSHRSGKIKWTHQLIFAKENGVSPGPVLNPYITYFNRESYLAALRGETQITNDSFLNFRFAHVNRDSENLEAGSFSTYKTQKNFASVSFGKDFTSDLSFTFFTDFNYDTFENKPFLSQKYTEERFEHGVVLEHQLSETEKLLVGTRYFPDQNKFVNNILGESNLGFYNLYASYSEGIKLPSFNQKYSTAFGLVPNPNLKSESAEQIEVGFYRPSETSLDFDISKIGFSGALFTIDYKNFIEYNPSNSPYSYLNLGNTTTQGFELSLDLSWSIYHAVTSYSFLDTKIKNSNAKALLTPKHQAYLLLGAQLGPVVFELQNTYWSSYKLTSSTQEKSWIVTDVSIKTEGLNNWFIKTGVSNIFNKQRAFTRTTTDYYPEPGKQYYIFVERQF